MPADFRWTQSAGSLEETHGSGVFREAVDRTGGLDIAAGALGEVSQVGPGRLAFAGGGEGAEAPETTVEMPSAAGVLSGGAQLSGA